MTPRRLTRCRHDKRLAGVASGMAEYLGMDPTVVRILWILSVFFGGFSILLYIILAFVMPLEPTGPIPATAMGAREAGASPAVDASSAFGATAADGSPIDPSVTQAWSDPGPAYAAEPHAHRQDGDGRLGLGVGVLLVVFGSIALFGSVLPGWVAGIALGPAFLVALGIAFVVIAVRRPVTES